MGVLIKNALVVNADRIAARPQDILVGEGRIKKIGTGLTAAGGPGGRCVRPAGLARADRSAYPSARTGPGGQRDHRDRLPGRGPGRIHHDLLYAPTPIRCWIMPC